MVNALVVIGIFFLSIITAITIIFSMMTWNIPVTVLRFTGDKRRPMIIHRKAKKKVIKGVPHLWVKGYKDPVRDYKAEYYYPSPKSKWGGLILWEFEDGWLTPTIPKRVKVPIEVKAKFFKLLDTLKQIQVVDFEYDPKMHDQLTLKIVDDVDADFYVDNLERIDTQYSAGFFEFLEKNAGKITVIMIAMLMLVGWFVWLDKAPEFMATCANAAKDTLLQGIQEQGLDAVIPPG